MPYFFTSLIYLSAVFLLVSVFQERRPLIAIFSFIFGHFFGANNWLAVRWHLGINASTIYGLVLVPVIVLRHFQHQFNTDQIIKKLRWVMLGPMLFDMINTLAGQPASYGFILIPYMRLMKFSFLLIRGWYAYVSWDIFYFSGIFWLVSILPRS